MKTDFQAWAAQWTAARAYTVYNALVFFFFGVYLPFLPGWLDHRGFSETQMGFVLGMGLVLRLLLAPPIAYRAERMDDPRRGLQIITVVMGASLAALVLPLPNVLSALFIMLVWVCFGLVVPITDTALLRAAKRGEVNFGAVRAIASISFLIAATVGGVVIARFGDEAVVIWCALAGSTSLAVALLLPREPSPVDEDKAQATVGAVLRLIRSRSFVLMLGASGLVQGAHAVYYGFTELHWSALGYSSALIGQLWAFGVICEVILLFVGRPLTRRISPPVLLAISAAAAVVRWPIMGLSPPLYILFALQALHAFTFAIGFLGAVEFVDRAVPKAYRTTAMTVKSNLGIGAMTGIATIFVGQWFNRFDPFPSYLAMGAMGLGGLVFAIWLGRRWDGGEIKSVPPQREHRECADQTG